MGTLGSGLVFSHSIPLGIGLQFRDFLNASRNKVLSLTVSLISDITMYMGDGTQRGIGFVYHSRCL